MLETATKYVLDLITENEELKKFPKEFVNESVKWVKSWFLKPEDPKISAQQNMGIISMNEAGIERNKINVALASLMDEIEF